MFLGITYILWIAVLIYCSIILTSYYWLKRLRSDKNRVDNYLKKDLLFSIIIPARDEATNIASCIESILANSYSNFEVIVIDDHSEDRTAAIVTEIGQRDSRVHLWKMSELLPKDMLLNSYKKKAISLAIERAQGDYIITTDADCTVGKHWLALFAHKIAVSKSVFIAAPVKFVDNGSFLGRFQCLDFISLQGVTIAGVSANALSMCNGANLCYQKVAFATVNGFDGVDKLASGDDMFLMYKMMRAFPQQIAYLYHRESIVETLPMPDLSSFVNQRIRWASKSNNYDDKRIIVVLVLVYLANLLLLLYPFLAMAYGVIIWKYWLLAFIAKTAVEMLFMVPVAQFFNQGYMIKWFPIMEPFHIIYTIALGFLGKTKSYRWKGRKVK